MRCGGTRTRRSRAACSACPTLAIGDALFWGLDATEMARDYAAAGSRFTDPEYARVAALPEGVQRDAAKPQKKPKTRVVGTAT